MARAPTSLLSKRWLSDVRLVCSRLIAWSLTAPELRDRQSRFLQGEFYGQVQLAVADQARTGKVTTADNADNADNGGQMVE